MKDRAQTPEEKQEVLDVLAAAWAKYPELRLGQLLSNSMHHLPKPHACLFNIEDKTVQGVLEKYLAGEPYPTEGRG